MRGKTKETDSLKNLDVRFRQLNFTAFFKAEYMNLLLIGEENAIFQDQGGWIITQLRHFHP